MTSLRWSTPKPTDTGYSLQLCTNGDENAVAAQYQHSDAGDVIVVGDATWRLSGSADSALVATLPDGRVFTAQGRGKKIGRAARIDADLSSQGYTFVNEVRTDWIIDDASNQKVAQFTGAGHGVRHPELELEDHPSIPADHAVFLAYIARAALETKMLSSTMVLTICLALIAPFTLLVYLLA